MLQNATPLRKSAPCDEQSLVQRLPRKMHLCRSSSHVPRLPSFVDMLENPYVLLTFDQVQNPLGLPRKTTSEPSKVLRACGVFMCFQHVDLETCFAPQWRAIFQHLNFQKCSEPGVLSILTWKCASGHNGVHFLNISTSKSAPRMVCFVMFCTFWLRHVLRTTTVC